MTEQPSQARFTPLGRLISILLIAGLIKLGVQFAVCDLSTHAIAGLIARDHGITADAAYKEITTNLIGNGRLVPAGIVAVNRAQERGYSIT